MDELMAKAQETADKLRGGITALTGTPGVTQLMTRNDLTPVADGLIEWTQNLVEELQAEKLAHLESRASRLFLKTVADIYQSVSEGMVLKNKEEEHKLAIRRTNDIISTGIEAWEKMQANG